VVRNLKGHRWLLLNQSGQEISKGTHFYDDDDYYYNCGKYSLHLHSTSSAGLIKGDAELEFISLQH
jgi:hypothetical protein